MTTTSTTTTTIITTPLTWNCTKYPDSSKMLSNPLQRFSPYHSIPSNTILSNAHVSGGHLHAAGLETFGHGPQYALQHLQQHVGIHAPHLTRAPQQKHRQHPYGGPGTRATGSSGPIRRRISRACDQCNQLRTKCDGQHPCAHCIGRNRNF